MLSKAAIMSSYELPGTEEAVELDEDDIDLSAVEVRWCTPLHRLAADRSREANKVPVLQETMIVVATRAFAFGGARIHGHCWLNMLCSPFFSRH